MANPNILDQDEIAKRLRCKRPGDALRLLRNQGIDPVVGRDGSWFVTLGQIERAKAETADEDRERI